jgi:hypothetical protein
MTAVKSSDSDLAVEIQYWMYSRKIPHEYGTNGVRGNAAVSKNPGCEY